MRINCPNCGSKARITSSNEITPRIKDLYAQCMDTKDCGASFVFSLAFKNYLNPPVKNTQQLAASLIRSLPKDQQRELLQGDVFS
jgi:hypothetical protein